MTTIADMVGAGGEKILGPTVQRRILETNELVTSGLAVRSDEVTALAAGGPRKASLAIVKPLDATIYNIGTDVREDTALIGGLNATSYMALRHDLNGAFGYADLTQMVTKYNTEGGIVAGMSEYWNIIQKNHAIAAIKSYLGVETGAEGAEVAELVHGTNSNAFSYNHVIDATVTGGVYADLFDVLIVGPRTYGKMRKDQSGFVPASETKSRMDEWNGFKLIKSKAFSDNETVMARSGSLAYGLAAPAGLVETEIVREGLAAKGAGNTVLINRQSFVAQVVGSDYKGPEAPTLAQLADPANWGFAITDREQIGVRLIRHTVA